MSYWILDSNYRISGHHHLWKLLIQKQSLEVFCKKGALKNFANFTRVCF